MEKETLSLQDFKKFTKELSEKPFTGKIEVTVDDKVKLTVYSGEHSDEVRIERPGVPKNLNEEQFKKWAKANK